MSRIATNRERLRALADSVVSIAGDLDLRSTLDRVVSAACQLTSARYCALGVIGPDRTLVEFISHGVDSATQAAIGELPHGHGVLGLLIDDPRPVRLPEISAHPQAYGFPAHHPAMHTFLGVPIRVRGEVFGNLYLSDKAGGEEFSDDDEELVVALATAAGGAIENARLYAQTHRRQRWLEAAAEITSVLLGEVDRNAALRLVAARSREVAQADLTLIMLAKEESESLVVEVGYGPLAERLIGSEIVVAGTALVPVVSDQEFLVVEDLGKVASWPTELTTGTALLVPLASDGTMFGCLVVAYLRGSVAFAEDPDVAVVRMFAGQAALALERVRAQEERELFAVLSDRERIARDLHDVVIQRLFAAGMQLQGAARTTGDPEVLDRLNTVVDDLDQTIRDIRGAIFALRDPMSETLPGQIRTLMDKARIPLGFRPMLYLDGPLDSAVPDSIKPALLAVLREALSNVVQHAAASHVEVSIRVEHHRLAMVVADDGVGIDLSHIRHSGGLQNMWDRAETLGGHLTIEPESGGTTVRWEVPFH